MKTVLMSRFLCLILFLGFTGCSNETDSRKALQRAGFTEIEILGWDAWACGKDDTWSTAFRAKTENDKTVSGTVCCGLITKNCTIRY